ncbi:armadillo-type protein [Myxozyma melibiosi]|uniref:Armadillo-type protein n=1 Tax=Myxozyma melibiosi TaxID=54550 RepID=A0ABR1F7C8_9ASCO
MEVLKFDKPLAPKAGKPIAIGELLKRLQAVHGELQRFDQSAVDLASLQKVAKDLVSSNLLRHKDKGVRAYTACCLADILRLFAPDAPYTMTELQNIFDLFVKQLKELANTESPYFQQYCYLLESLSQVKSIVLVADLNNSEEIMNEIFSNFFDLVKPDGMKNLEFHMGEILVQLVEEVPTISQHVVSMILAQFLRPLATTTQPSKNSNGYSGKVQTQLTQLPPAYNMAKTICINCSDRISRYVAQYFIEATYELTTKSSSQDITESELTELKKAHNLLVEIWKACPEVLQSTIPQLEQEILTESTQIRLLATQTVGLIAGEVPGRVNFMTTHASCWEAWLGRQNDRSALVRSKWAEGCAYITGNRADAVEGTVEGIAKTLIDNDERVRLASCKAIGTLDYKVVVRKFKNEAVLNNLAERSRDRKYSVRAEAIRVLGSIYDMAAEDIAAQDVDIIAQLSWIPNRILDLLYVNQTETTALMDYCIFEHLLPTELDDKTRVTRMLNLLKYLDPKTKKVFQALATRQKQLSSFLQNFILFCEKYNGGVLDDDSEKEETKNKIDKGIKFIADQLPDAAKASSHLEKFVKLNDRRMYKLIRDCTSPDSEYATVIKSLAELKNRINQSSSSILETLLLIMYRGSQLWYNRSNISTIVEISKDAASSLSSVAQETLKHISELTPQVLKVHIQDLAQEISANEPGFQGSVDTLKACAGFARKYPDEFPQDRQFLDALVKFATKGSPGEAKHAVKILLQSKKKHAYARDLLGFCTKFDIEDPYFLSQLAALAELVKGASAIVETEIDRITSFLIKNLVVKNRTKATEEDKEWVEDEQLEDECKAKILALRILVNRLRAAATSDTAVEIARPVLKLLNSLIVNDGEMSKDADTPLHFKSRLRLAGGLFLLKLAKFPVYDRMISPENITTLTLLVQDRDFQVRQEFVDKLKRYLAQDFLPDKYIPIVFLTAYEPDEEVKDELVKWLRARLVKQQQQKNTAIEKCFPRLLHLLAHHPDYGNEPADLLDIAQYIVFYLNATVTEDNISLIFYFAQRVKQVRDAVSPENSERLYYLSDLSQAIIRQFEDAHGWSMQTWPGKVPLPGDLFKAMQSSTDAQRVARTSYLPEGVLEKIPAMVRVRAQKPKPAAPAVAVGNVDPDTIVVKISSGKKRKSTDTASRKKKKAQAGSDDEWDGR